MIDLSFDLTPEEALSFWKKKMKLSPGEFAKLEREAKLMAFAVSGIARGDELNTVYNALAKAIEDGVSFADFKKECAGIFERRGWTGKRAWRIDTIFRTNIQTAYNVGNYQQMMRVKERRPYWRYSAVNDSRTRPAHRAVHGKIFPADHPFWDKWFPPNGFRCRCSVNSVSEADLESNGWKVEEEDPTGRLYEPTDPRTGVRLPGRLLMPDPGWDFHVGREALKPLTPSPSDSAVKSLGSAAGARPIEELPAKPLAKEMLLPAHQKSGWGERDYVRVFLKEFGADIGQPTVFRDVIDEPVVISDAFFLDRKENKLKVFRADREVYLKLLADTIKDPVEIWLTRVEVGGKQRICKRYVGLYQDEKQKIGGFVVFDLIDGEWQGTTAFRPRNLANLDKQREGTLLYTK